MFIQIQCDQPLVATGLFLQTVSLWHGLLHIIHPGINIVSNHGMSPIFIVLKKINVVFYEQLGRVEKLPLLDDNVINKWESQKELFSLWVIK
jgi:hypothetical protein